jgi:hypothetical protein
MQARWKLRVVPSTQDYFELGVILTRKKLYTQATKNLEKAKKVWEGEETELAQVGACLEPMCVPMWLCCM